MNSLELPKIKEDLEKLIGKENVSNTFYKVSEYCINHVAKNIFAMSKTEPFIVARPQNLDQLVKIVKYAFEMSIPLFIRGGGTGYSGGEVPTSSGIVIELTGLNRIINVDDKGRYVTCEAGITVKELNEYLQKNHNLTWFHDPGSRDWATVGGSVSTLGVGAFSTKYGYAHNTAVAMKIVTADGEIIEIGNKIRNDYASYNFIDLFASSEGTLGIIAEVTLKVFPVPKTRGIILGVFKDFHDAVKSCYDIVDSGLYPESLMIEDTLRFLLEGIAPHINLDDPILAPYEFDKSQAALIVTFVGKEDIVNICQEKTKEMLKLNGAKIIENEMIINAYWKSKTELPSWSKAMENVKIHSFVPAIPLSRAAEFNEAYDRLVKDLNLNKAGARYYVILPWMECTVSPSILLNDNDINDIRAYEEFTKRFSEVVMRLGGTPASTTGVGMRLIDVLEKLLPPSQMMLAKKIKLTLDPKRILSPNKKLKL
jgi:glycolate oxidase